MALSPKESGEFIAKNAKHVKLNDEGIDKLSQLVYEELKNGKIKMGNVSDHECYPKDVSPEEMVDWLFLLDTLNFCFWSDDTQDKWEVDFKGKTYTGYFALCAAISRAIEEGVDLLKPEVYSKLSQEELLKILRGKSKREVPLIERRVANLQECGSKLIQKYQGSFVNCVKAANKSAQELLRLVVTEFECFNDSATYLGQKVSLHKRAQILVADIWCQFSGEGYGEFHDIDTITMFADYRVPQPLVYFGAMSYSDELMEVLKSNTVLKNGSEFEVEIRGCSIECVERLKRRLAELQASGTSPAIPCNSTLIDNFLWLYRREHADTMEAIPFHKVLSIYY